jgi:hypothetical protein
LIVDFREQTGILAVKHSVNINRPLTKLLRLALLLLGTILCGGNAIAVTPVNQPIITSLSVAGTNLIFNATISPGVVQTILELRPTLDTEWQETALLDVPVGGGFVEFIIPKPALDSAFFRLRITTSTTTEAQFSTELQYVTMPSLGSGLPGTDAVFHFKGIVDGSDRILITRQGAFWEHVNWDWPAGAVTINGTQWNPREKNYLTTTGAVAFLPETFSLEAVQLEIIGGRDVVALERTNDALVVYLDDTQSGAAMYEFKIHFRPAARKPAAAEPSPAATLKIAAAIDGSDSLKITANEAKWQHRAYAFPWEISLNGIAWNVRQTNTLVNAGTNTFLPPGLDFSTARIVNRKGRDLGTMWADADALWIQFADNPNGADSYELEIAFGR